MYSRQELTEGFRRLGVRSGHCVMLHASVRFFAPLVDTHLRETHNSGGPVGDAQAFLLSARGLLEFALPVMRAVAGDPGAAAMLTA